jgi:hypothetical protein
MKKPKEPIYQQKSEAELDHLLKTDPEWDDVKLAKLFVLKARQQRSRLAVAGVKLQASNLFENAGELLHDPAERARLMFYILKYVPREVRVQVLREMEPPTGKARGRESELGPPSTKRHALAAVGCLSVKGSIYQQVTATHAIP